MPKSPRRSRTSSSKLWRAASGWPGLNAPPTATSHVCPPQRAARTERVGWSALMNMPAGARAGSMRAATIAWA